MLNLTCQKEKIELLFLILPLHFLCYIKLLHCLGCSLYSVFVKEVFSMTFEYVCNCVLPLKGNWQGKTSALSLNKKKYVSFQAPGRNDFGIVVLKFSEKKFFLWRYFFRNCATRKGTPSRMLLIWLLTSWKRRNLTAVAGTVAMLSAKWLVLTSLSRIWMTKQER